MKKWVPLAYLCSFGAKAKPEPRGSFKDPLCSRPSFTLFSLVLSLLLCGQVFAQNIAVRGKVTGPDGLPISNASVLVQGTNTGTTTNDNGDFTINAAGNGTLVISIVGYNPQTIAINGRSEVNLTLTESQQELGEVVVTALGIERSAKSLTYNTTSVSAEDLNQVKGPNVLNNLAGRAAGVFVTQGSGGPGSSPRVVIRGNKSISGNNQPLYVVDGVPIGGFSDFNQEDIESMTVLQGASAAALYGSSAANGVILITTKKGQYNTTSVNIASSATFENPMTLPEVQTSYGRGSAGEPILENNDSWGPEVSNGSDAHIRDFFQTGRNLINSVSVSGGNDNSRVYASYQNTDAQAMIPGYNYQRHNFTIRGTTSFFDNKLTVDANLNYIRRSTQNSNSSGWYDSPMFGLYLFPIDDDMEQYKANGGGIWNASRLMYVENWPYILNQHSSNQNPYWIINNILNSSNQNRTNFMGQAKWAVTDWLSVTGRTTYNTYGSDGDSRKSAGSDPLSAGPNGSYSRNFSNGSELYSDLLINVNKNFETVSLAAFAGTTQTVSQNVSMSMGTAGTSNTLVYPNFFSVQGLQGPFNRNEGRTKTIERSVLGGVTLGYKETVFLDATARNDWSSSVDDPFFYPSVGLSYILSENLPQNDVLTYAKIRATYSEVGNGLPFGASERAPFYNVDVNGNVQGRGSLPFFDGTDTIRLKPERTKSFDIGADLNFFKNSLNLSVTYYNATTQDQVFTIQAPSGAGANNFYINGGTIQNWGVEASLSYRTQFGQVSWMPSLNFTRNQNRIKMLSDLLDADRFVLRGGNANRLTNLYLLRPGSVLLGDRKYGAYHDLFGRTYQYDENGKQLFNEETGMPLLSANPDQYLGNANPDFLLAWNNQFRFKDFSLSFLIDSRWGGLISSSTEQWLDYKGLSKRSGEARKQGGVKLSNGTVVDPEAYYVYISGSADFNAAAEEYVYDATNIRLREIALGYTLPQFTSKIKSINVSVIARNLFFLYKKAPFDPELAYGTGNDLQGFENFQMPSARSIGVSLRVGF